MTTAKKKDIPTHARVICKTPATAMCESITTVPKERIGDFIKTCTIGEIEAIDQALAIALALPGQEIVTVEDSDIAVERDIYKDMYERLLDKIIKKEN